MSRNPMFCEACGTPLHKGDLGTTTINGGHLCQRHTPRLSEIVAEYNTAIIHQNYQVYEFPNLNAMKLALRAYVTELTTRGDSNVAVPL